MGSMFWFNTDFVMYVSFYQLKSNTEMWFDEKYDSGLTFILHSISKSNIWFFEYKEAVMVVWPLIEQLKQEFKF